MPDLPIHPNSLEECTFYLAGPMTGYPDYNREHFRYVTNILRKNNLNVLSPHEIIKSDENNMAECVRDDMKVMLALCNALILLKGWPESAGVKIELQLALGMNFPIFYFDEDRLTTMTDLGKSR